MQIIAGALRGRKIKTLEGDLTRPTSGLVRGAMFSILGDRLQDASVLDLYSGSGAIALESLSRGAERTVSVEKAAPALKVIEDNFQALGVKDRAQLVRGDVQAKLSTLTGPFDVVIADPPYRTVNWSELLTALQRPGLLSDEAVVLFEHKRGEDLPEQVEGLQLARTYRYGESMLTLYMRASA